MTNTQIDENERVQELVVLRGLPGSGKSTYAKLWVAEDPDQRIRVNRDDIRFQLYGKYSGLTQHQENTVSTIEHAQSTAGLNAGLSVIIDATNLRAQDMKDWISAADKRRIPIRFVDIETSVEECIKSDSERFLRGERHVGAEVIRDFAKRYLKKGKFPPIPPILGEKPVAEGEMYEPDESLPGIYLFDIDGTLAKMHGRSPYAWSRVGEDSVVENVARVARLLSEKYPLIIFSGRDEVCYPETEEWLARHGIQYKALHMRPRDTDHPDDVMKLELFDQHVRGKYNVLGVFDDRLRVCRMWERIGLTLFRVGPIDADF